MIKTLPFLAIMFTLCFTSCKPQEKWTLVWEDNFDGTSIDDNSWTKIDRGGADWNRHMSHDNSLYEVKDGNLILHGKVNTNADDSVKVITGGVYSKDKVTMTYGKIEVRAKLGSAKSAWPAFWLLPNKSNWPDGGEIDLMEHLNHDSIVYQTIHTHYTYVLKEENPPKGGTAVIDVDGYNTYGLEWYQDSLVFLVNDKKTFSYPKIETDKKGQWPFNEPFYLLLDMQLGGSWVGPVDTTELPVKMEIDWVRIYEANPEANK